MELGLRGKVAMVAASSKGLGFGIARELAREGAMVSIGSRNETEVFDVAETLAEETGTEVLANVLDVSCPDSIAKWMENTNETFGDFDDAASYVTGQTIAVDGGSINTVW